MSTPIDERRLTAMEAYQALQEFVNQLPGDDLATLSVDLDLDEKGNSFDRAVLYEWLEEWGEPNTLEVADAYLRLGKFIHRERYWSKDEEVQDVIRRLTSAERDNQLWSLWIDAVKRGSDR